MPRSNLTLTRAMADKLFQEAFARGSSGFDLAHRESVLRVLSGALGCLVTGTTDPQLTRQMPDWSKISNCSAVRVLSTLGRAGGQAAPLAHVIGVHFTDSLAGRFSQIWGAPSAIRNSEVPKSISPYLFWELYCRLWMRTYWRARRTSLTLLSAFQEGILKPRNSKPVLLHWHNDEVHFNSKEAFVAVRLPFDDPFVIATRELSREFDRLLKTTIDQEVQAAASDRGANAAARRPRCNICVNTHRDRDWSPGASPGEREMLSARIEDAAYEALKSRAVVERLEEVRSNYIYRILTDKQVRSQLAPNLKSISPHLEMEAFLLSGAMGRNRLRLHQKWGELLHVVEALQSAVLNEPRFCHSTGLLVGNWRVRHRRANGVGRLRLVVGFKEEGMRDFLGLYTQVSESIQTLLEVADEHLNKQSQLPQPPQVTEKRTILSKSVVDNVYLHIRRVYNSRRKTRGHIAGRGLQRWIEIVRRLASESIHEGDHLNFWMGCGPAYVPTVQGHLCWKAPSHLSALTSSVGQIVHYCKAYFSLFGTKGRILWFDGDGRFQGVYEGETKDPSGNWLIGNWEGLEKCCFARIVGLNKIDFRDKNGMLLSRVIENEVSCVELPEGITNQIRFACSNVFDKDSGLAKDMTTLLESVVRHLRDEAHGAGLVISTSFGSKRGGMEWRCPIDDQVKALAPPLGQLDLIAKARRIDPPIIVLKNMRLAKSDIRFVIDRIKPLAKLDGAVWLSVDADGLRVRPASQFIPLVRFNEGSNKDKVIRLFDLIEGSKEWEESGILKDGEVMKLSRQLNSLLEHVKDIEKFQHAKFLAAIIRGTAQPKLTDWQGIQRVARKLVFLNSAGTRHHSLWGISLTTREKLFTVALSQDGHLRVFWSGRVITRN